MEIRGLASSEQLGWIPHFLEIVPALNVYRQQILSRHPRRGGFFIIFNEPVRVSFEPRDVAGLLNTFLMATEWHLTTAGELHVAACIHENQCGLSAGRSQLLS